MFRHLSPKATQNVNEPTKIRANPTQVQTNPFASQRIAAKKEIASTKVQNSQKNNIVVKRPEKQKIILESNQTKGANKININKSSQNKNESKNQNYKQKFDDYYEKKLKYEFNKDRKQGQTSLSNDSYQSEGVKSFKKVVQNDSKSISNKVNLKGKNLVVPANNNLDPRSLYKSPIVGKDKKSLESQTTQKGAKRILSFINKKPVQNQLTPKHFEEVESIQPKTVPSKTNQQLLSGKIKQINFLQTTPNKKQTTKVELDTSSKANRKQLKLDISGEGKIGSLSPKQKLNLQKSDPKAEKNKKMPKFISNVNIKSSPYLNKYAFDTSNQLSREQEKVAKKTQKKIQTLLQMGLDNLTDKNKQQDKSLSFNKHEMFQNLKKKQERHSLLSKQINIICQKIELKIVSHQQNKIDLILLKKVNQTKKTGIFLAYHEKTGGIFCLKRQALFEIIKNDTFICEIIRQHKIHQFISHPHLVKVFCSAYDQSYLYLIMQFMENQTLGQELRTHLIKNMSQNNSIKTKINESVTSKITKINTIRKILFQILQALDYLHNKGITHRDLKPDNIFVSHVFNLVSKNTYKIGDFGSATHNFSKQYVGTLDYAAPEILQQLVYDQKIDIWSIGCIAYELDVGRPPFYHINPQETKRLAINAQYDRSLISDNDLTLLIDKMLQKNSKARLSAKQLLQKSFFSEIDDAKSVF